jgi:hypothetical protein
MPSVSKLPESNENKMPVTLRITGYCHKGAVGRSSAKCPPAFLSHRTADKPDVENLVRQTRRRRDRGLAGQMESNPRRFLAPAIEDALQECESCVVFVGSEGLGPWQIEEMRLAINRRDLRQRATIPRHSGFTARSEARELAGAARKHHVGEFRGSIDDSDATTDAGP